MSLEPIQALSPQYQEQREIEAILKDPRLQEIFDRNVGDVQISQIRYKEYLVRANGICVVAKVIYTHDEKLLQPKNFRLEFSPNP